MAKNLIFEERSVGFALHPDYGIYFTEISPPVFALTEGENYTVQWDGVEYTGQAGPLMFMGMQWQVIGNRALLGGENTGEPFGIGSVVTSDGSPYANVMATIDTADSHTVGIWHGVDVGIVLKNRDGEPVVYDGINNGIDMLLSDGTQRRYVDSADIPVPVEKTVSPDFSGGDMVVTPKDGELFSKVSIPKPENLIPDNIAEGVNIAGIIGALAGGGGNVKIAVGTTTEGYGVIAHNLGVIPDIVMMFPAADYNVMQSSGSSSPYYLAAISISSTMKSAYPELPGMATMFDSNPTSSYRAAFDVDTKTIEEEQGFVENSRIHSATESTFSFAKQYVPLANGVKKVWLAIGGLT